LSIQGRHQLACIKLVARKDRGLELNAEKVAGLGTSAWRSTGSNVPRETMFTATLTWLVSFPTPDASSAISAALLRQFWKPDPARDAHDRQ
jgi:hypothetical protein